MLIDGAHHRPPRFQREDLVLTVRLLPLYTDIEIWRFLKFKTQFEISWILVLLHFRWRGLLYIFCNECKAMVVWREGEKVSDSAFPSDLIHCRADLSATNLQLIHYHHSVCFTLGGNFEKNTHTQVKLNYIFRKKFSQLNSN